jgi:hypothetical protein
MADGSENEARAIEATLRGTLPGASLDALAALLRPLCGAPTELVTYHRSLRPTAPAVPSATQPGVELELVARLNGCRRRADASQLLRFVEGMPHTNSRAISTAAPPRAAADAALANAVVFTPVRVALGGAGVDTLLAALPFEARHAHARTTLEWTQGGAGSGGAQLHVFRRHPSVAARLVGARGADGGADGGADDVHRRDGEVTITLGPCTRKSSYEVVAIATGARLAGEDDAARDARLRRQVSRLARLVRPLARLRTGWRRALLLSAAVEREGGGGDGVGATLARLERQLLARGYDEVRVLGAAAGSAAAAGGAGAGARALLPAFVQAMRTACIALGEGDELLVVACTHGTWVRRAVDSAHGWGGGFEVAAADEAVADAADPRAEGPAERRKQLSLLLRLAGDWTAPGKEAAAAWLRKGKPPIFDDAHVLRGQRIDAVARADADRPPPLVAAEPAMRAEFKLLSALDEAVDPAGRATPAPGAALLARCATCASYLSAQLSDWEAEANALVGADARWAAAEAKADAAERKLLAVAVSAQLGVALAEPAPKPRKRARGADKDDDDDPDWRPDEPPDAKPGCAAPLDDAARDAALRKPRRALRALDDALDALAALALRVRARHARAMAKLCAFVEAPAGFGARVAAAVVGADRTVLAVSPRLAALARRPAGALRGRPLGDAIEFESAELAESAAEASIDRGKRSTAVPLRWRGGAAALTMGVRPLKGFGAGTEGALFCERGEADSDPALAEALKRLRAPREAEAARLAHLTAHAPELARRAAAGGGGGARRSAQLRAYVARAHALARALDARAASADEGSTEPSLLPPLALDDEVEARTLECDAWRALIVDTDALEATPEADPARAPIAERVRAAELALARDQPASLSFASAAGDGGAPAGGLLVERVVLPSAQPPQPARAAPAAAAGARGAGGVGGMARLSATGRAAAAVAAGAELVETLGWLHIDARCTLVLDSVHSTCPLRDALRSDARLARGAALSILSAALEPGGVASERPWPGVLAAALADELECEGADDLGAAQLASRLGDRVRELGLAVQSSHSARADAAAAAAASHVGAEALADAEMRDGGG